MIKENLIVIENADANDVLDIYDELDSKEREKVKDHFEDELEDEIQSRLEENFDYNDLSLYDLNPNTQEWLYRELNDKFGGRGIDIEVESLYDQDKVQILKKAFQKYTLNELIEKLGISQAEAMY